MGAVETAEGRKMEVEVAGDLLVAGGEPQRRQQVLLGEALVPKGLQENLISVGAFCDQHKKNKVVFDATDCFFLERGEKVLRATRKKGEATYQVSFSVPVKNRFAALTMTRAQRKREEEEQKQRDKHHHKELEPAQPPQSEVIAVEPLTASCAGKDEAMLIHQKLDHLNLQEVRRMVKAGKEPASEACVEWLKGKTKFACRDCAVGKNVKKPLKRKNKKNRLSKRKEARLKKLRRSKVKEVRAGMDLSGPFGTQGVGSYPGVLWAALLRMKKSKYSWLRFLKHKNKEEVFDMLSNLLPLVLATLRKNRRLVILTDLGSEWVSEKVENLFSSLGIEHRYTSRSSSLRNGICERHFRTLEQGVATARQQSGLSAGYWPDLMETGHEVRLHTPCKGLKHGRTPFEEETGKSSADFRATLQPVGCLAAALRVQRTSMGLRGEELVYLGPKVGTKDGARCLNLKTRGVVVDRSVVFVTDVFPCRQKKAERQRARQQVLEQFDALGMLEEEQASKLPDEEEQELMSDAEDLGGEEEPPTDHRDRSPWEEEMEQEDELPRPRRATGKPNTYQPGLEDQTRRYIRMLNKGKKAVPRAFIARARALVANSSVLDEDPKKWQEAMKHKHWRKAWAKELETLWAMGAFEWAKPPAGAKVIGSQIVWKTKRDENNEIEKHKARGVARGDQQVYGETYSETFAPTVRMDSVRMMFSLASWRKWGMRAADVDSAFLISHLPEGEDIFMHPFPTMRPPPGKEDHVLLLRRSLYGIKQAPMLWSKEVCAFLREQGYVASSDPCLFLKRGKDGKVSSAVLFHVDDFLCTGEDKAMDEFIAALKAKYAIKDLGEPTLFLGMGVKKTKRGYMLSQEAYLDRLLEKFNMSKARLKKTPIVERLYNIQGGQQANATKYRELVGGLMYLMACTRPDLCFAVNQLTRHFQDPQDHHWRAALRVLAYLKHTKSHGLVFEEEKNRDIKAYTRGVREFTDEEMQDDKTATLLRAWSDADWAGDKTDRKSTAGYLLQLGRSVISYRCQKQAITATSSTTAELIALTLATKEVLWEKKLYEELFDASAGSVPIMEDNQGAKILADSNKFSHKTKHLPLKYFFCREKVKSKEITVEKVGTKDQLADIFTKPLGPQVFLPLREKLGVVDTRLKRTVTFIS
jgi:hypothetical protein